MQVTVRLQQATPKSVAYDHGYRLGSALYEAVRAFNPDFARELHRSTARAPYAVGEIYHLARRRGEAWFRISSADEKLLRQFGGALLASGAISVGDARYRVSGVDAVPGPESVPTPFGVHTMSPILIKDRESPRSLVMDNCDYGKVLADVINHDVHRATGRAGSVSVLRMEKLVVRKRTLADRTVMAQKGTFWLDGDGRDIAHLLDFGIGHSTALGFGLVVPE